MHEDGFSPVPGFSLCCLCIHVTQVGEAYLKKKKQVLITIRIQDANLIQIIKAKAFLHIPFNKAFHHKILCSVILVACSNKTNKQKMCRKIYT